ncbi:hypothetical protein DTO169C6_5410 [Paecilomyces variotii]|nr:hypothetical protein DTO169C6_5410 [Paecilomyces variotii]
MHSISSNICSKAPPYVSSFFAWLLLKEYSRVWQFITGLQGPEKLKDVTQILDSLRQDLTAKSLSSTERTQLLLKLRQHGTNPVNADPIYSKSGIETLMRYGVDGETTDERRAALRCVANSLLLDPKMRQIFVDTGYGGKLAEMLKTDSSDDEMIISRILFLSTYDTTMDFEKLINAHGLGDNINYQISRHAEQFVKGGKDPLSQMDEMALTDTLKLIFNIAKLHPDLMPAFSPSISHILEILSRIEIPKRPLDGLVGYSINCLSVLDLGGNKSKDYESSQLFPASNQNRNVDSLINILKKAVATYKTDDLDSQAITLLHLLIIIYEVAPEGPREHMRALLLPEKSDRSVPIGQTDTLSSKLLKLSTTPSLNLKTAISELMFVLSGKDAETLTKNIGYGFAAGFLSSRGLGVPQNTEESGLDSEINPITGQRWDAEPVDTGPPMTQEEKEREAERLFVLFERAKANGLINVENPVVQAAREGRLEELPDDADSD